MRANCTKGPAAQVFIRPPVPRPIQHAAIVGTENVVAMTHGANGAALQHGAHRAPAIQETKLMIDQCQGPRCASFLSHASRFGCIQRHWFFAEHSLALFESGNCDLDMCSGGRDYTYQIDIIALDQFLPIAGDNFNAEFFSNALRVFAMLACYSDHARSHAIAKARDLGRARETRADNAYAYCFSVVSL